ncbi:MAG: hypothetical protein LLG05_03525, partial [Porphyromonadaceae bacterium]|nr:hypothetical protein [Porphyromonadaceae bacterium]
MNVIPFHLYQGLKEALERNGYLNYSFDLCNKENIKTDELIKYPVLFVRGYLPMYQLIVKFLYGKQRMAMIETETPINN